ncbi:MAG: hypothetical protein A3F84_12770 [Candidatus Handelsmanbacteria bacterium RIFCSPLOWO2_12_FULL_64_10]|uniref:DnaJ homologue subfamily C member 28 conserved domain-containing protein n=1 Tax=Handelsmanbacteria sp. (strain RIFCSPLOWO2_12_FULL_64_10) TaxID=1817868 RepID=A0A1F6CFU6_HANXR|nr:MAG: hypothetical protein A3F84_12770 [Candidatus Handelsmanbacteria bacterium RIFCSPLOWO2_12_FULL_64_10]
MNEKNPKFRRPDGRPELRGVDDILRDAAARGEFDNLPGKGRPLDLDDYFTDDPEHRIANRLLKDNKVLPQPLQDRKEAEALLQTAQDLLAREDRALQKAQEEIRRASAPLMACFPDRQTAVDRLGIEAWPFCFAEPAPAPRPDLRRVVRQAERLRSLVAQYNGRVGALIVRYLDLLEQANRCIRRHNDRLALTGGLRAGFQMMVLCDVAARAQGAQGAQAQFPALPPLPEDLPGRIRAFCGETRRPFWKRLLNAKGAK